LLQVFLPEHEDIVFLLGDFHRILKVFNLLVQLIYLVGIDLLQR